MNNEDLMQLALARIFHEWKNYSRLLVLSDFWQLRRV